MKLTETSTKFLKFTNHTMLRSAQLKMMMMSHCDHRHLHLLSYIFLVTLLCCIIGQRNQNQVPCFAAQAQQVDQPLFIKSMDLLNVRENTPVGESVYTLVAQIDQQQQPNVKILYDIEGTNLFSLLDRASGEVRVAAPIDREQTGDSVSFQVVATPHSLNGAQVLGPQTKLAVIVYVLDENDNAPRFEQVLIGKQKYDSQNLARNSLATATSNAVPVLRLNVSEDTSSGSVIVDSIEAIDLDKASASPLSATCLNCAPEFRLLPKSGASSAVNDRLELKIVLDEQQQLVHVPRNNTRRLLVIASDGKFNSSLAFDVTIDDVQNKPPYFVSSTTCVVPENTPIDKTVLTIRAVDGDALAMEAEGPISMTALSGGGGGSSSSTAAYSGRQIIYDFFDQETKRSSSVQDDFKLNPLTGQLQVASRLDREAYLEAKGVLSLQVRARELTVDAETVAVGTDDLYESILAKLINFIDTSEDSATISEITVIIMDVNDNSPRWLNTSEIAAMNAAPVWHASLPSDRDTGRNYQVRVRENSPPGTPLTSTRDGNAEKMFVYDLDAGDNAEFNITLDDPFNLFDVEPKRVSGFSSVTLKLANHNHNNHQQQAQHRLTSGATNNKRQLSSPRTTTTTTTTTTLLDYENINERSYIIQLYAVETKTREQFRSKAQIQVNVLDVNDNAPEFKEPAYVANVREDAPAGKIVKLVQASDRDEISKQLVYSLHGASSHLFDMNAQTGHVTVAKCSSAAAAPESAGAEQHRQQQVLPAGRRSTAPANTQRRQQQQQQQQLLQQMRTCLDYETQRQHNLMVEASDGELSSKVPLTIYVEDASDNAPVFALPIVDVVIEEGAERLEPPIRIEASDVDQTSTLSYSIVEGNFEGLFAINNVTGELQLTRAIRIAHDDLSSSSSSSSSSAGGGAHHSLADHSLEYGMQQLNQQHQQRNKMTLIVQASDGQHSANGTIRIDILDANDNAPEFLRPSYEKEIAESLSAGSSVLNVRAIDLDSGNNARVSYRIERGSHGQFDINETSGEIIVARDARPFDALAKRDNYTLEVVAYDHGLVSKSTSVLVTIRVLPTSRRAPRFEPQVQRATVSETTLNNTIVHRMLVAPGDSAAAVAASPSPVNGGQQWQQTALMFEPGPIDGLDKNGQPVLDIERLGSMLSVSTDTGDVLVVSGLDHNFAAHINLTIYASYRPQATTTSYGSSGDTLNGAVASAAAAAAAPLDGLVNATAEALVATQNGVGGFEEYVPRSVGYLVITVLADNRNAPIFAAPWTPQQPELTYQMLEELPVGSILAQLVASDADSKISHFEIDPPNEYFQLTSPQSGVIVNRKLIDYDTLMGQTLLSPGGHSQQQQQQQQQFGATSNYVIQFNVIVYDSGLKQLSAKAIVSVEILPVNDNDCKFEQSLYEVHVRENAPVDTLVAKVRALDADYGAEHNSVSYALVGSERDLFSIEPSTGIVRVSKRGSVHLDRERLSSPVLSLALIGRDHDQSAQQASSSSSGSNSNKNSQAAPLAGRTCSATLRVHVDDVNDNPPLFSQKQYEVTAYDTDTIDVPLVQLIVHDDDSKHHQSSGGNNATTHGKQPQQQQPQPQQNSFKIMSGNVNDAFNVTQTGMIYVTKPLNEVLAILGGKTSVVELRVQVKQQSAATMGGGGGGVDAQLNMATSFTDDCLVRVSVMKINRFVPEWRADSLANARVEENAKPGTLVTQLKCVDRDYETSSSGSGAAAAATSSGHRYNPKSQMVRALHSAASSGGGGGGGGNFQLIVSPIRYWIKENGTNVLETSEFRLDSASGNLITRTQLDREKRAFYQLIVSCEDNGRPQSLESITPLYVTVLDADDNKPEFLARSAAAAAATMAPRDHLYGQRATTAADGGGGRRRQLAPPTVSFAVEEHQSKGLQVGELKAIDRDLNAPFPMMYCLLEGNDFQEFSLDRVTGILYTNQTLDREKQATYDLLVGAYNDGRTCEQQQQQQQQPPSPLGEAEATNASTAAASAVSSRLNGEKSAPAVDKSLLRVRVDVLDINDNAPVFRRAVFRAGAHHRSLMNTLVTQVAALDPDNDSNGTLSYRISKVQMYKTSSSSAPSSSSSSYSSSGRDSGLHYSHHHHQAQHHSQTPMTPMSKPIELIQSPFKIDKLGNIYTQQLLTQYQLMSMFVLHLEATELAEPWRTASTKLEIYLYETSSQLKIRINLHPRLVETYRLELETLLSNATKYSAIINRARAYQHQQASLGSGDQRQSLLKATSSSKPTAQQTSGPTLDLSNQVPTSPGGGGGDSSSEPNFSNIHAIFVDNHRLVNPNLVMEKFDLTSAQMLFTQQSLNQLAVSAAGGAGLDASLLARQLALPQDSSPDSLSSDVGVAPLIDKIALASAVHSAEFSASPSSLAGIDWLESPSVLFVCLASMLTLIGFIICLFGCCCTSRIKDHIIKVAMDKLVKQQTLQAKINERVLAATNQAYANSALGSGGSNCNVNNGNQMYGTLQSGHTNNAGGHHLDPFMLQQASGLMSSFDATKGCANNNYENMSILQRAMEAGEFIDPNYTTLNHNGHLNLGAHYYDASELENNNNNSSNQQDDYNNMQSGKHQGGGGSVVSLSLGDEEDEQEMMMMMMNDSNNHHDTERVAISATTNGDLNGPGQQLVKKSNQSHSNGVGGAVNGMVSSHSRLRQQIPNGSKTTFTTSDHHP